MTHIKIRIEFGLFEWMTWYQDNMPGMWAIALQFYLMNQ